MEAPTLSPPLESLAEKLREKRPMDCKDAINALSLEERTAILDALVEFVKGGTPSEKNTRLLANCLSFFPQEEVFGFFQRIRDHKLLQQFCSFFVSHRNRFDYLHQWTIGDFRFDQEPEPQPEHQAVDAEAFVRGTFPPLHPLAPDRVYQCGICQSGPDERNEDGTIKVFRSMNCCPQQMCCHDCLVHQATACNTPDSEFKNTRVFICPFARHETDFFPPNLTDLEENYKLKLTEQIIIL
jgi:hypothetical protein